MKDFILLAPILCSFFLALFLIPFWMKKAKQIGLMWNDMNKYKSEKVAGSGGIIVVASFVIGVLLYVAYRVFILKQTGGFLVEIFAILTVILLLSGVGVIDDLLGWQRGGLSRRSRIILCGMSAIPLMVIKAGDSATSIPFFGEINFGLLYPLILVPIGIIGATTTFNFLAGYNGLEAGQGIILLSALVIVSYFTGTPWLSVIGLCMISALLAFLIYNFYPAKIFPGDSLTYATGGLIAIFAIVGNFEKIAFFFFIPYILETILKLRVKLIKQSFGKPKSDGTLDLRYEKIYGLEHLAIVFLNKTGIKATEKKVVYTIWTFQLIVVILGFFIFRQGIFK